MKTIPGGLSALLAGVLALSGVAALADTPPPEAQIAFAKKNIWNWQVVDNNTVLIQDVGRRWYKATLFGNCINLPFSQRLAFESNPSGSFDKFSTIRVQGQRCPLTSLVETTAPPKKPKPKKPAVAADAAQPTSTSLSKP
jgi:Family of unknown function (DUF6491)